MRRFVALLTALMLLTISCVPMVAAAAPCKMTTHAHHAAEARSGQRHMALRAHHHPWQGCIICGCGCHSSLDTLPHLLAPHAVGTPPFNPGIVSLRTKTAPEPVLLALVTRIPLPPPQAV